jgi:hypothetical protein
LEFFDEALAGPLTKLPLPPKERCCSRCNPSLVRYTPLPTQTRINRTPKNLLQWYVLAEIKVWAAENAPKLVTGAAFRLPLSVLLSEDMMTELACKCTEIHTISHLSDIVGSDWLWMDKHGQYLLNNLKSWFANAKLEQAGKLIADQNKKKGAKGSKGG